MAILHLTSDTLLVSLYLTFSVSAIAIAKAADEPCKDRSNQCTYYKSTGWYVCGVGSYMYDYCRKTCGYCDGGSIPTRKPGCHDFEKNCLMWIKQGQCKMNPKFMTRYCCQTCRSGIPPTLPPKVTTTAQPPFVDCKDADPNFCKSQGYDECKFQTEKMYEKCKLTCKMCAPGKNGLDLNINCPQYKELGYCHQSSVYYPWTTDNCKFTCPSY